LHFGLTPRWHPMAPHAGQVAYYQSSARFISLVKGRRAGGTELGMRKMVRAALLGTSFPDARFFLGAPVQSQAEDIFWTPLRALLPPHWVLHTSESKKQIRLVNGSLLKVVGLDEARRIEGPPWDGCLVTEFADLDARAWPEHIFPALADRSGFAILESAPEGRNHQWVIDQQAREQMTKLGPRSPWAAFHWTSEEVLPLYGKGAELEMARENLDERTYAQEYRAEFVNFAGRAYHTFDHRLHCAPLPYDASAPLIFCFDFNVEPGTAVVCQEMRLPLPSGRMGTGVIGEVWIPRDSNTTRVCEALYARWRDHQGLILCYGDPAGGHRATSQTQGTDWDLILTTLRALFRTGPRVAYRGKRSAPSHRDRINAVNSRLLSMDGGIRMMVDPEQAPHVVTDLEGVMTTGDGHLDKGRHAKDGLTHLSDAVGYYIETCFPVRGRPGPSVALSATGLLV